MDFPAEFSCGCLHYTFVYICTYEKKEVNSLRVQEFGEKKPLLCHPPPLLSYIAVNSDAKDIFSDHTPLITRNS